jgi:hypothetical protein
LFKFIFAVLIISSVVCVTARSGHAQPQLVASNGFLSYNIPNRPRSIAIAAVPEIGPEIAWLRGTPNFRYDLNLARRDSLGIWNSRRMMALFLPYSTLWAGRDSTTFIYYSIGNQLLFSSGDTLISRLSDNLPAMDSLGCFHLLDNAPGMLIYEFSRDTLQTFEVVDTLIADFTPIGAMASPDRGKVAICFIDYNILHKCLGSAGQPLNIDSSSIVDYDWEIDDIALDDSGNVFIAYNLPGDNYPAERYIWNEQFGSRWIHHLDDPALNQTQFELAFCPSRHAVIGIETNVAFAYQTSTIDFSTDGGDTWNESLVQPQWGNASSPRLIGDTLYLASQNTDSGDIYFQAISVDDIMANAVGMDGKEPPLPGEISLSNYPNPFNASTTISFNLPATGHVLLAIYDIAGREIKRLVEGYNEAGLHSVVWNGINQKNKAVSSGVYFVHLEVGNTARNRRMILLR